jgi:beta-aspartyl-peptidase (threonine type)
VIATVRSLEDHPLFNAGVGSLLTVDGTVEMDASIMVAAPRSQAPGRAAPGARAASHTPARRIELRAGGVAAVTRVRNPILLARAVMELTPHVLIAGAGAERLARRAGVPLCRPDDLVTPRARARWRAALERRAEAAGAANAGADGPGRFGTVGAAALDAHGVLAAATSTGGVSGKLRGRIGDSAIIGAGTFADARGAASATGQGEAIMKASLCREAMAMLGRGEPRVAAERAIAELAAMTGGQAGIVMIDRRGRIGFAHNAEVMDVAMFDAVGGFEYRWAAALKRSSHGAPASSA